MLDFQLDERGRVRDVPETIARVYSYPEIRRELKDLTALLDERVPEVEEQYPVPDWPLALHRHYERREIVAAAGYLEGREKKNMPMSGILMLKETKQELLLVTLDKSASSFSPTTSYKDYAISRDLFHWETQSAASVANASGRRYLESPKNGWRFYLFVRTNVDAPYAFVGPVTYVSHTGDRPIAITWRLEYRLSAALFDRFATLDQG